MKHFVYSLLAVILLIHTSCHSTKNVSSTEAADINNIASSDIRMSTSKLDSALSSMSIQLDSFVITAEPVAITPCPDSASTRSAMIAYRYHIKANSATVKGERIAVSRSTDDTLQQDSTVVNHTHSSARSEVSDKTSVYKPPDLTWVIIISIVIAIIFILILWKTRK